MPYAMRYDDPQVQQHLARSYVAGTLCGAARQRFETLRARIPALDERVRDWEEHLQPLADAVPELSPRATLWGRIDASLNAEAPAATPAPAGRWWGSLKLLRGLAFASSLAAVALAVLLLYPGSAPVAAIDYVAVLTDGDGEPRFVATASAATRNFDVRVFGGQAPAANTDYQLWAISKTDGEPRSLGLLDPSSPSQRVLSESDWRLITDARELLVTAELPGGSAIGEPSDDIVSRGLCIRLRDG